MRTHRILVRRLRHGTVSYDERTGEVCDARSRSASRRERDLTHALSLRGPR